MAIYDLTDDARLQYQIASDIGAGIGAKVKDKRLLKQAEQKKELDRIRQQNTVKILSSGGSPDEMWKMFEQMPELVDSEWGKKITMQKAEQRFFGTMASNEEDLAEFRRLQDSYSKVHNYDPTTGTWAVKPGFETVSDGMKGRLIELGAKLFGQYAAPKTEGPAGPTEAPVQKSATDIASSVYGQAPEEQNEPGYWEKVRDFFKKKPEESKFVPAKKVGEGKADRESPLTADEINQLEQLMTQFPEKLTRRDLMPGQPKVPSSKTQQYLSPGDDIKPPSPMQAEIKGKELSQDQALELLKEAGWDKEKARKLAKKRGYKY